MHSLSRDPFPLGKSGLSVSPLSWGMWRFAGADVPTATRLIHAALDAGIGFLDTAAIYGAGGPGFGAAETLLGEVLRGDNGLRARMTLATKGGIVPGVPYDSSAASIAETIDASLARLGVETIDLFMIHRPDPLAHPAEVAGALDAAVASGKVRAIGVSNYTVPQVRALVAHLKSPLACNQIEYSPLRLAPLADGSLDLAEELGFAIMAWSPLGGGRLGAPSGIWANAVADALDVVAEKHGVSRTAAAYAWIMAHPARPIPIVGSQVPGRIAEAADAFKVEWTRTDWLRCSPPRARKSCLELRSRLVRGALRRDRIAGGRLTINIISSDLPGQTLASALRCAHTVEAMEIVHALLNGDAVDHAGEHYQVKIEPPRIATVARRCPPCYFGGLSPDAREVAAIGADVYLMWPDTEAAVADIIADMRARASKHGRNLKFGYRAHVVVRETEAEAREAADQLLSKLDAAECARIRAMSLDAASQGVHRQAELREAAASDGYIEPNLWTGIGRARSGCGAAIVGDPDQLLAKLARYRALGIEAFILSGYPHIAEADLFARHVLPRIAHAPLRL